MSTALFSPLSQKVDHPGTVPLDIEEVPIMQQNVPIPQKHWAVHHAVCIKAVLAKAVGLVD